VCLKRAKQLVSKLYNYQWTGYQTIKLLELLTPKATEAVTIKTTTQSPNGANVYDNSFSHDVEIYPPSDHNEPTESQRSTADNPHINLILMCTTIIIIIALFIL